MKNQNELKKVTNDFNEVVKTINDSFGTGYASKNPGLVQHLMDKIQQQEDRHIYQIINNITL